MNQPIPSPRRLMITRSAVAFALACSVVAGCGDDDEDAASTAPTIVDTTTASSEAPATTGAATTYDDYCDAAFAIEEALGTAGDDMGPDLFASMAPLTAKAFELGPPEIADELAIMKAGFAEMAESGDFAVFERPDVAAAGDAVHGFEVEHCFSPVAVAMADYSFALEPPTTPGRYSFETTNEGAEFHVLVVARALEGTAEAAWTEVSAAPDPESVFDQFFEQLGSSAVAPGDDGYSVAELLPGSYVMLCPIPMGSTMEHEFEGDGPPHFVEGMLQFFDVA